MTKEKEAKQIDLKAQNETLEKEIEALKAQLAAKPAPVPAQVMIEQPKKPRVLFGANTFFQSINLARKMKRHNLKEVMTEFGAWAANLAPSFWCLSQFVYAPIMKSEGAPERKGPIHARYEAEQTCQLCCIRELSIVGNMPLIDGRQDNNLRIDKDGVPFLRVKILDGRNRELKAYPLYNDKPTTVSFKHAFWLFRQDRNFRIGEWDYEFDSAVPVDKKRAAFMNPAFLGNDWLEAVENEAGETE